jgi:hypothetical protein
LIAGLLLALGSVGSSAQEMAKPPRLSFAQVDWPAAIESLAKTGAQQPSNGLARRHPMGTSRPLARLNAMMAQRFAGLASSPIPVLLPFDVDTLARDLAEGAEPGDDARYLAGFHVTKFFYPGPAGYDAAFVIHTSELAELSDIKFAAPIEVQISGSRLLYELDNPIATEGSSVAALEPEFPGIRRLMIEHSLRYTFTRFGVPYLVSISCYDANVARYKMPTCHAADRVAQRFLRALRFVGGTPLNFAATARLPIDRPGRVSQTFGYYAPGQLFPGTGFRGQGGREDYTVYSQIRFPLAEIPVYANTEVFRSRNRMRISDLSESPNISYSWRDNFCERRSFPVAQCPSGIGHQGQDIRPAGCKLVPGSERCEQHGDILAVRDGMILRSPKQEAAYLFVNTANEHIRFRYLHMSPRKMDGDNLLSGRRVDEGEVIGEVGNFSMKAAGTSYHLHFDIQVPTRTGWVFVNPYMTLVSAYERMIGARGTELVDPIIAEGESTSVGKMSALEKRAKSRRHYVKHSRDKSRHRVRQAQR